MPALTSSTQPDFEVFTIVRRKSGRDFWQPIGAAWMNADGSIKIKLNALPTNAELHLMPKEKSEAADSPAEDAEA